MNERMIRMIAVAAALCGAAANGWAQAGRLAPDFDGAGAAGAAGVLELVRAAGGPVQVPVGEVVIDLDFGDGRWGPPGHRRPGGWRWERVKALAHRVEDRAGHVRREAEARAHHDDWSEARALRDLRRLEQAARHFHRQVESWRQDPRHTRSDYYELRSAFYAAASSLRFAHAERHVRADFEQLRYAIQELEEAYRGGWRDHDDHHEDRHDDHGRRRRGDRDHGDGRGRHDRRPRY